MDQTQVTEWLRKSLRNQIVINAAGAFAIFLAGIGILVLTWGFVYVVSWFALGPWLGYHHWAHVSLGLALIPALFWGNARASQEYLSEYSVTTGTASDTVVSFYLSGVGTPSRIDSQQSAKLKGMREPLLTTDSIFWKKLPHWYIEPVLKRVTLVKRVEYGRAPTGTKR